MTNRQLSFFPSFPHRIDTPSPDAYIFRGALAAARMSSTPFGEHLKREREMRGVSLEEIALATRIAPRFLAALESEQWEKLPGGVFNRGFIRSIAHYLGLDEDSMVAEYALHTRGRPEPGVVADPPTEPETPWRQILVLVIFIAVVIAAGWFAVQFLVPRATAYLHKRSAAAALAIPDAPRTESAPPSGTTAPAPANGDTAAAAAAPVSLALKLEATHETDVTIVADGKPTFSGHLRLGDVKEFAAAESIEVSSNDASAILLDLNGQMVLLPGQPGQSGSITLTQKDLKGLPAASH
jgi:cytoskeleton protein RodZ